MRKGVQGFITGCALGLASQAIATAGSAGSGHLIEPGSCHSHIHALVAYLEETARLEGSMLVVEWRRDGSVVLRRADFTQHLWCQDEELHIEFGDAALTVPKR